MAIRVRLGHYEVDNEPVGARRWVWKVAGATLLLLAPCVVFFCVVFFSAGEGSARDLAPASTEVGPTEKAAASGPFLATNWGHLEKGQKERPRASLDTDLSSPEWRDREALMGLKAITVYEARAKADAAGEADAARRIAESAFGGER